MLPKSFSATALGTAASCHARYHAENLSRTRGTTGNAAANLGSSVHGALELYVKRYQDTGEVPDEKFLLDMYALSYIDIFQLDVVPTTDPQFKEGVKMLKEWYVRTKDEWQNFKVISCEVKENFPVKTSVGEIPFNYIWDRCDDLGDGEYRVVDYKTNKWGITPSDLLTKVQARMYGLAAQIKFPDATKIWVEFDMLRHGGPVAVSFTRADNAEAWKFIKERAAEIIEREAQIETDIGSGMSENEALKAHEKINNECLFCVRKTTCAAVRKNVNIGGLMSFNSVEDIVDERADLEMQMKAMSAALKEFDAAVLAAAKADDRMDYQGENAELTIGISGRRNIEPDFVEAIIGEDLFKEYGSKAFSVTKLDQLLKGNEINDDQKRRLKQLIHTTYGEPRVKVKSKSVI